MLKNQILRVFSALLFCAFISIFSFSFTACDTVWFGNLKDDLKGDTLTGLTFQSRYWSGASEPSLIVNKAYLIDSTIGYSDFPNAQFKGLYPGYHVDGWNFLNCSELSTGTNSAAAFCTNSALSTKYPDSSGQTTASVAAPSELKVSTDASGYVSSVKVTPYPFALVATWAPDTDTPYTVYYYLQNKAGSTTITDYELGQTRTFYGTTDSAITASTSSEIIAITGFTYEGSNSLSVDTITNLEPDGSSFMKLYYSRNSVTVTIDWTYSGSTSTIVNGLYGADLSVTVPTRSDGNYTIAGYTVTVNGTVTGTISALPSTLPAEDTTYTAIWTHNSGNASGISIGGATYSEITDADISLTVSESTITFTCTKSDYESYQWYFNGTDGGTNPSFTQTVSDASLNGVNSVVLVVCNASRLYGAVSKYVLINYSSTGLTAAWTTGGSEE